MRANFIADEYHGARDSGIGKYCRIMSGSARNGLVRQTEVAGHRASRTRELGKKLDFAPARNHAVRIIGRQRNG